MPLSSVSVSPSGGPPSPPSSVRNTGAVNVVSSERHAVERLTTHRVRNRDLRNSAPVHPGVPAAPTYG